MSSPLAINPALVAGMLRGFLAEETAKVGFRRVVVGLSGGLDSAVACCLAAEALGPAQVLAVLLPYRTTDPASVRDALAVVERTGVRHRVVEITAQVDAYLGTVPEATALRRGNKMARERMSVLYDLSLAEAALVLGTSNKTELLLGYGTLHGDMAHALNPLGDLYKTQVYELARTLGVPEPILAKAPSADLFEGQSDEADLGFTYADADRILFHLVDERRRPQEVVGMGFSAELFATVAERMRLHQYKRRLPLIAKLSRRTIDQDFRYPRDWGY